MPDPAILFAGDPHGNFAPILRACAALPPGALVLVGDCDCRQPLARHLAPALAAGWRVHWILGNHDTETEAAHDHLTQAPGNLALAVTRIGPWRVAGLPGVFRPRVWQPPDPPCFHARGDFLATLRPDQLWRGHLPLWHRDTLFPEDFDRLARRRFDILVAHEAPSSHPHGHAVIDDLAAAAGARLIVHGHHHQSYAATLPGGIAVRGLGLAEPWLLGRQEWRALPSSCS